MRHTVDVDFAQAIHAAVNGDASPIAALLHSGCDIGPGERERLIALATRCAELARGDVGGTVGRPTVAAGSQRVRQVVERYNELLNAGLQKTQAKMQVGDEFGLKTRMVEQYIARHRQREAEISSALMQSNN